MLKSLIIAVLVIALLYFEGWPRVVSSLGIEQNTSFEEASKEQPCTKEDTSIPPEETRYDNKYGECKVVVPDHTFAVYTHSDKVEEHVHTSPSPSSKKRATLRKGRIQEGYGFIRPVPGKTNQGRHGQENNAVDLDASIGTPIEASRTGLVEVVGFDREHGGGNFIVINHGGGVVSTYAHLSQINVKVDQRVEQREIIGLAGNTGNTTGPHLHFGIRCEKKKPNCKRPTNPFTS